MSSPARAALGLETGEPRELRMPPFVRTAILLLLGTLSLALAGCGDSSSAAPAGELAEVLEAPSEVAPSAPAPVVSRAPAPAAPPSPPEAPPAGDAVAASEPESAPELEVEFETLETRLRESKALGVFTKLELKNQISALLNAVRKRHEQSAENWNDLREAFDLLVLKVMTLLQDKEADLAREIARSRESLWAVLTDPVRFAKLEAK